LCLPAAPRAAGGRGKRASGVALTKFRGRAANRPARAPARAEGRATGARPAAGKEPAESQKGKPTALGRMRLVRRVRDGLRKRNPILRLFGAF
jgi:hypothetical protein